MEVPVFDSPKILRSPLLLPSLVFGLACIFVLGTQASQAAVVSIHVADGVLLATETDGIYGEAFAVPDELVDALRQMPLGAKLSVLGLPTAPGERRTIVLERRDPWAAGARLTQISTGGFVSELPKGKRLHFVGEDPTDNDWRMGLMLDPQTGELEGISRGPGAFFEIFREGGAYQISALDIRSKSLGIEQSCHQADLRSSTSAGSGHPFGQPILDIAPTAALPSAKLGGDPTYQAIIALDTDNEFHDKKFDNDTTEATDWIESLFTTMNVLYERDLDLRLIIGDTTFRLDTDPSPTYDDDPWTVGGSGASSSQLAEFGTYWSINMIGVERVMAALLSGKSSSGFSASGIAWVDGYCETQPTGGGYSINQIFTGNVAVSNDARLVGHELGHNFGSSHTHCYDPPIDTCYGVENGCYSGSTSCPAGGMGTVMSYCNFNTGCNTANLLEFHPTVISLLEGFRNSHYPACVTDYMPPGTIFEDGFESGNTSAWTGE